MKSMKATKSYVKYVRYYIIRRKLLHYMQQVYYIIRQLLHYQAFLLHYQAVITLTGDCYIIGCNNRVIFEIGECGVTYCFANE